MFNWPILIVIVQCLIIALEYKSTRAQVFSRKLSIVSIFLFFILLIYSYLIGEVSFFTDATLALSIPVVGELILLSCNMFRKETLKEKDINLILMGPLLFCGAASVKELNYINYIFIASLFLDALYTSYYKGNKSELSSSLLSSLSVLMAILINFALSGEFISEVIVLILWPIVFHLFPFHLTSKRRLNLYSMSTTQKIFILMILTNINKIEHSNFFYILFGLTFISTIYINLFSKDIKRAHDSTKGLLLSGFTFLLLLLSDEFNSALLAKLYWLSFVFTVFDVLRGNSLIFKKVSNIKLIATISLFLLVPIWGPMGQLTERITALLRINELSSLGIILICMNFVALFCYVFRLFQQKNDNEQDRSFGPWASFVLQSTIILGVILSI